MSFKPYIRCGKCRELLPREQFPDKPSNATGKRGVCLNCEPPPAPKPKKPSVPKGVRWAMCERKIRYRKRTSALSAALRSARHTQQIRVYRCPLCNGWHLTRKEARAS